MQNKYSGTCVDCNGHVAAGAGKAFKLGKRWAVSHDGKCSSVAAAPLSFKAIHGHCEDAPCCGCCGGGNDYMSGEAYGEAFG